MMPVGRWKIQFTPLGANTADAPIDCPLVPNIVPIQMLRIGSFSIVGVPAEFTTISGRRLTQTIKDRVGDQSAPVIISNYTNAYSGYVTTEEEYGAQHYEGASTLYGPHTLAAYQQEIGKLATDIISSQASTIAIGAPFEVPAKFNKLR
jgi:neutral ceramidase